MANIRRKDQQHKEMTEKMMRITQNLTMAQLGKAKKEMSDYNPNEDMELPSWLTK